MSRTTIRDFHDDDLDGIVRLYEDVGKGGSHPVYALSEVIASCREDHAIVAVNDELIVGAAVGRAAHAQGWIVFFALADEVAGAEVGAHLLDALEHRMAPLGLGKLSILVPEDADRLEGLTANGFDVRHHLRYLERQMPVQRRELDLLKEVGGRILPRNLWGRVSGMRAEKQLLEERLVTPLANPDLADRFGVVPPRAVMLFGPPGTGKTTFARAVASRLDWPFVELFPSRLSDTPGGLAAALRGSFEVAGHLEHAVVFIDEVEEIASQRGGIPPSPTQGVTNELLKLVADFREQPGHLLICATNFVRALDSAFLRHGRFDYVIPIGLPDAEARQAIWQRYIPTSVVAGVAVDDLVTASDGFTPADIEYAARKASQEALARTLRTGRDPSPGEELTTEDYLAALADTRATVSEQTAAEFLQDITSIARL
ncbi:MAG TPA: AAA family ATPase [Propionicimonas sp.]|jgi:hypothetical protein